MEEATSSSQVVVVDVLSDEAELRLVNFPELEVATPTVVLGAVLEL